MAGSRPLGAVRFGGCDGLSRGAPGFAPPHSPIRARAVRVPRPDIRGRELRISRPARADVVDGPEHPGLEPGEIGGAECRGFDGPRPFDRDIDDVREGLQQPGVLHHAAVDPKAIDRGTAVGRHCGHQVAGLQADGFEGGAGEMRGTGVCG